MISNLRAAISANDAYAANLENAKSRIVDTDYAKESSNLAKYNILSQSGVAMLSQANSLPQLVTIIRWVILILNKYTGAVDAVPIFFK